MSVSRRELGQLYTGGVASWASYDANGFVPFTAFTGYARLLDDDPFVFRDRNGKDPLVVVGSQSQDDSVSLHDLTFSAFTIPYSDQDIRFGTVISTSTGLPVEVLELRTPHPTIAGREIVAIVTPVLTNVGHVRDSFVAATDANLKWADFFLVPVGGGRRDDTLAGSAANERFFGYEGDDTVRVGLGRDQADGGRGTDTLDLSGRGAVSIVLPDRGESETVTDANGERLTLTNFERVIGTKFSDAFYGSLLVRYIDGAGGDDFLRGNERRDTLIGGGGHDSLRGMGANDRLIGGNGNDTLEGGAGNDVLKGGGGRDVFVFATTDFGADTILDWQDGVDRIGMEALGLTFGDLEISAAADGALVELGAASILLRGVDAGDIGRGDFLLQATS